MEYQREYMRKYNMNKRETEPEKMKEMYARANYARYLKESDLIEYLNTDVPLGSAQDVFVKCCLFWGESMPGMWGSTQVPSKCFL